MQGPSRKEVELKLLDLIEGRCDRKSAADWASKYVVADATTEDPGTWSALVALSGADLVSTDRDFLHGEADFCIWLESLKRSSSHD